MAFSLASYIYCYLAPGVTNVCIGPFTHGVGFTSGVGVGGTGVGQVVLEPGVLEVHIGAGVGVDVGTGVDVGVGACVGAGVDCCGNAVAVASGTGLDVGVGVLPVSGLGVARPVGLATSVAVTLGVWVGCTKIDPDNGVMTAFAQPTSKILSAIQANKCFKIILLILRCRCKYVHVLINE